MSGLLAALGLPAAKAAQSAGGSLATSAAVALADTRKPKKPGVGDTKGYKVPSFVNPSQSISLEPAFVGSIYFRTKEFFLDEQDEALLKQLAKAYAAYAKRNLGAGEGELGLTGNVVGFADPRRSVEPNNQALALGRAVIVARKLVGFLAAESNLIEGNFNVPAASGGIAEKSDDEPVEADSLAPMRRADIFLTGGRIAASQKIEEHEQSREKIPPKLIEVKHDWGKYDNAIDKGQADEILAMAAFMYSAEKVGIPTGATAAFAVTTIWKAVEWEIQLNHKARESEFPGKITGVKPSWWGGLTSQIPESQGRNGIRNELIDQSKLLQLSYVTALRYSMTYLEGSDSMLTRALEEIRGPDPDPKKMWFYATFAEYYTYMCAAVTELAKKVLVLAKQ